MQVFRLVTEDTIEEKVVERAQQKLKLDAMVVQQGRLNDKDKLSRDELLNAIRFVSFTPICYAPNFYLISLNLLIFRHLTIGSRQNFQVERFVNH